MLPARSTSARLDILPPGERNRRRSRPDRRKADRRQANLGSPYDAERRSGADDRQGDRRGKAHGSAGIGLTRDYFAQPTIVSVPGPSLPAHLVERFHD